MTVHLINVTESEAERILALHVLSPCSVCGEDSTVLFLMALPGERSFGKDISGVCLCDVHGREYLRDLAAVQPPTPFAV